jgi:Domain of unknown function (DUF4304)
MTAETIPHHDADAFFKKLLRDLRPLFKQSGFRSSSQNFTLETHECWAVINFQKSRWSSPGEKSFYINVSVTAKRVLAFQGEYSHKAPAFYACDWRWRAEQLGPDSQVTQWTIKDESTAQDVFLYLQKLFADFVIPAVKELCTETALINNATSNPGYPQSKAISILLAANNRAQDLSTVVAYLVERFGGGVVGVGVRDHLAKLRASFPEQMHQIER